MAKGGSVSPVLLRDGTPPVLAIVSEVCLLSSHASSSLLCTLASVSQRGNRNSLCTMPFCLQAPGPNVRLWCYPLPVIHVFQILSLPSSKMELLSSIAVHSTPTSMMDTSWPHLPLNNCLRILGLWHPCCKALFPQWSESPS